MHVLLIKTSSLGDVIHALPAITEASQHLPDLRFDWMIEEPFAEVGEWHPAVEKVIPVAIRRWRKNPLQAARSSEWRALQEIIKKTEYDLVIDAQGLLKSAFLVWQVGGLSAGYDRHSIREPAAAWFYQRRYAVSKELHAVERIRHLFAAALGYRPGLEKPEYGASPHTDLVGDADQYLVGLHGSSWASKLWPESNWIKLSQQAVDAGYEMLFPWGNEEEHQRAKRIATHVSGVTVLPKMNLTELAVVLRRAAGVVGVDGGPAHLAAAMSVPTVCLYGATNSALTGTWGKQCENLQGEYSCAPCLKRKCHQRDSEELPQPCFSNLTADRVFTQLLAQIQTATTVAPAPQCP